MIVKYPDLGFMVGMDTPPTLRSLLVAASERCRPMACSVVEPIPDPAPLAYVWCDSSARPPAGAPYAAWIREPDTLDTPVARDATVLLCESASLLDTLTNSGDERGIFVPNRTVDTDARPMLPFVRRRLREARDLPEFAVARGERHAWYWDDAREPLDEDLVDTAAACAAAVVATGDALTLALHWAAPTVTDTLSAAALGAVDGEHVLVVDDPAARVAAAGKLARDEATAARLSWRGRLLALERADIRHAAWVMLARLGLPTHPLAGRLSRLEHQLDQLGTPLYASVRLRLRSLVDPLPKHVSAEGVR